MSRTLVKLIEFVVIISCHSMLFAAEAKRPSEWDKIVEAAKKEGKIVLAIPPAAELRREMEGTIKRKLGFEAELVPNPGPKNASRIAAEQKAGVHYFDALIVGTGTEVWLPPRGLREALRAVRVVLDAMQTGPAIRTYNIMLGERRRVAAALIAVP